MNGRYASPFGTAVNERDERLGGVNQKRLLAVIPARGGSKGLPGKNILSAGGRPLIAWTIVAAQESTAVDDIILSSDDDAIIRVAQEWGCSSPFRRPASLAEDTSSSIEVVIHALDQSPAYDYVALLQPTSPLRTSHDIDSAYDALIKSGADSCVSVCVADESPYWMYNVNEDGTLKNLLPNKPIGRRQDLPTVYVLNGAIYIARVKWLRQSHSFISEDCVAYIMPRERSLDIDTAEDMNELRRVIGE